ncbi:MAG: DUF3871 family protein [Saprospiraceae bacterium]
MEYPIIQSNNTIPEYKIEQEVPDVRFIEANTQAIGLDELRNEHLIPVFIKDNQPTISQAEFIQSTKEVIEELSGKRTENLGIRVSHPIKGRIFEARHKKASELLEHEKTIYYERMAFSFDLPTIEETIDGKQMHLSVVGVKAYNHDNLNTHSNSLQHFKLGIGFKVKVCTNLCLFTDGTALDLRARNLEDLQNQIFQLVQQYDPSIHLKEIKKFQDYSITEQQFATLIGKARMYQHLPKYMKKEIPPFIISDSQISLVTRAYYHDPNFPKNEDGSIDLWNLFNLFTGAVKSSYIDSYLDRGLNAFEFVEGMKKELSGNAGQNWFIPLN